MARVVLLVLAAGIVVGACGGSDGQVATPPPQSTSTSVATTIAELARLTFVPMEELEAAYQESVKAVDDLELLAHLEAVKNETIRFADPAPAAAAGYERSPNPCEPFAGKHYVRRELIDDVTGGAIPEALMYEETADRVRLVGVEYFVLNTGLGQRPVILGQRAEGPVTIPSVGSIYWLHVWLYSATDFLDIFSQFNSDVRCSG